MSELMTVLMQHPKILFELFLMFWISNSAITAMPMPDKTASGFLSSPIYQWAFTMFHTLIGGVKVAINDPRIQAILSPPKQ